MGPFTPHALPDSYPRGPLGQGAPSHLRPGPSTPDHQAAYRKAQALGPVITETGMPVDSWKTSSAARPSLLERLAAAVLTCQISDAFTVLTPASSLC